MCRRIHAVNGPGVIMLTARDEDIDRILGLEIGADEFVTKPFSPRVLLAHIRAVLRRARLDQRVTSASEPAAHLAVGDLLVDLDARLVVRQGDRVEVPLTSAEFELLHCFVTRPQRVLSRDQILGSAAGELLRTVRNAGYILARPVRPG